ncbi:MAG: hypothetical protein E6772_07220 [Dysgonomonas sp.]|nr:hypothetical protein [Dysgonomonas sp.]
MNRTEAQHLLDIIYKDESTPEEKNLAYNRLSELFNLLLPEE